MIPDEQYNTITITLATLVAGQATTNLHLGVLNGKVGEHSAELKSLELTRAGTVGFNRAVSIGMTAIITLVTSTATGVIVYLLTHK